MKRFEARAVQHSDNTWDAIVRGPLEGNGSGPTSFTGSSSATKEEALAFGRNYLMDNMSALEEEILMIR